MGASAAVPAAKASPGGRPIQQLQPVAEHGDGVLESQGRDLRVDGGDLDRDDLDLRDLERAQIRLQTSLGFGFSQQGLSQDVDVHPQSALAAPLQVRDQQVLLGRENDVGSLFPHPLPDQRRRHAREVAAEGVKSLEQRAVQTAEEARDPLYIQNVQDLVDGAVRVAGAEGLVRELGKGRLVVRTLHHPLQLGLLPFFYGGLQRRRNFLKAPRQEGGFLRQLRAG